MNLCDLIEEIIYLLLVARLRQRGFPGYPLIDFQLFRAGRNRRGRLCSDGGHNSHWIGQ